MSSETVQSNWGCSEISFPQRAYYFNGKIRSEAEVVNKLRSLARQISDDADLLDKDQQVRTDVWSDVRCHYLDKHADKIPEPFIHILIEDAIHTEWGAEPKSLRHCYLFLLPTVDGNKVELWVILMKPCDWGWQW